MSISAGLVIAGQALDVLKAMRSVEKSYDAATLKAEIADLMDKVIDMKMALQDAREESEEKDRKISKLVEAADIRTKSMISNGYRYQEMLGKPGSPGGTPYCRKCDVVSGLMILTTDAGRGTKCPNCNAAYPDARQYFWSLGE